MSQQDILAFLASPAAYPENISAVERLETHGAVVFLAGEKAYKIKKNVSFPYMDYGTVEKRQKMCAREIELNKRTAPEIYLETTPITQAANGAFAINGEGTVVDWLVVMRRFDNNALLDSVADQQGLSPLLLQQLAEQIAAFHQNAAICPNLQGDALLRTVIEGNQQMFQAFAAMLPPMETMQLTRDSLALVEKFAPLLQERSQQGKVRRCHGDLYLKNIFLQQNKPVVFDCIEFNDAFAEIDVLYDLAFLLMDMEYRGFTAEANQVLNHYNSLNHEGAALVLLPLLKSMRAAIRAHVSVAISQGIQDATLSKHFLEEASRYLQLAQHYIKPHTAHLGAVGGLSGSGKSTFALHYAAQHNAVVLRSDVVRKQLFNTPPLQPLPASAYAENITEQVYATLFQQAKILLEAGTPVILDAVFAKPQQREAAESLAQQLGLRFQGFWLEAPSALAQERLQNRQADASDATPAIRQQQEKYDLGFISWEKQQG